ncbi:MAG: sialate O-acetylesterase, partial [Armatimonadota bacterium]|nr:sialate O-acetylesterase [Armatimonadota bacterium]
MKRFLLLVSMVAGFRAGAVAEPATGGLRLSPLFSDGMVLQRGLEVPIWGEAAAGQPVTVSLNDKSATATADANGKWMLRLPPLEAGGPFEVQFKSGQADALVVKNVLVGDVWVASGQSNMAFAVRGAVNAEQEIAAANDPQLRMFTVARVAIGEPQTQLRGSWQEANPQNVGGFSAVGYFFARELRRELRIPIGIIHSSWGGSSAQAWMRREVYENDPDLQPTRDAWKKTLENYPQARTAYEAKLAEWQTEADKAKAEGRPEPAKPREPPGPTYFSRPSALYNGMIAPLLPYAIKGVIWYQGEANSGQAKQYRKLFPALIANWRQDWKQGDFPFLFVQLAGYLKRQEQPSEGGWAEIREAQQMTLSVPNTGMALAIDIGEAADVHPKNKQEVGRRLALAALAQVYGRDIPYSGPLYDSMTVEGN